MLLAALDPALLIYQQEHWEENQPHWLRRVHTLALHRRVARKHNYRIGVSQEFVAMVYESFPWSPAFRNIKALQDLRQFILHDLTNAYYVNGLVTEQLSLLPDDLTGAYVESPEVLNAWKALLHGCVEDEMTSISDVHIATWETPTLSESAQSVTLTTHHDTKSEVHHIPLVWDENSWTARLACLDAWPDLRRCVDVYFLTNSGMQKYPGIRNAPMPFVCTDGFWKTVDDFCQPQMRLALVKAIAKKVYGILDTSLGDEAFGPIRRFRVTKFWRIHYRDLGQKLVLDEFGEHDMGI